MRVLVTGGRTYLDVDRLHAGLDLLNERLPGGITEIIEGGAPGADIRARWWAERRGDVKITTVMAEWEKHSVGLKMGQKNPAGMIRNREMADMKPDVVLACPGGPGTAGMVALAKSRGLHVVYLIKMVPEFPLHAEARQSAEGGA